MTQARFSKIYFIIYAMVQIKTTHVSKSNIDGAAKLRSSVVCAVSFLLLLVPLLLGDLVHGALPVHGDGDPLVKGGHDPVVREGVQVAQGVVHVIRGGVHLSKE